MSWGWHCAGDHDEHHWAFSTYQEDYLLKLPAVYPCWDQFRSTIDLLDYPKLYSEARDVTETWDGFLEQHWNHRLLIVNEYGDLYPFEAQPKPGDWPENAITCECRGKPRATIHTHEATEG